MGSASMDWSAKTAEVVPTRDSSFNTTHWSAVLAAGGDLEPGAHSALEFLCTNYWYPLYVYVRRQGHQQEEAKDLTQEFFARLLELKYLRLADPARGRFRTFLLTSMKHFLINDWKKANRWKRGGGLEIVSLDSDETETRFRAEPADDRSPDKAFARRWATLVLDRVLDRLQCEFLASGRGQLFDELKGYLAGEESESSHAVIARRLGMTAGNVKVSVHRLRRRYRELLREEIAVTVEDPKAVEDEIRELFAALSS
jgi:RNA polymerase sigma factor (sigma-70 family)